MKAHQKKFSIILLLFMIFAGISLYLEGKRYKTIEINSEDARIKVKIDRWTGKRYRTLYRVDASEAVHDFHIKVAPSHAAAPVKPAGPATSMKPPATASPPPSLPPSKAEVSAPADKAFTKKATAPAPIASQRKPQSLPTPEEHEKVSVKSPQHKGADGRVRTQNCGFPVTSSELINLALRRWCKARQDAGYQQMRREERAEIRSMIWEDACRKGPFASYWKTLPFDQRKELSRIYFKIARF